MHTDPHPIVVGDIMSTNVVTVHPSQPLADAIALLAIHQFHHLLVMSDEHGLVGVISDRDLLAAVARLSEWRKAPVYKIMTARPFTVRPECPLAIAAAELVSKRINCLPVLGEDQAVVGIVTSTDLLRCYQNVVNAIQRKLPHVSLVEFSLELNSMLPLP